MANIQIKESVALAPYTTFRIGGAARYFVSASSIEEISEALVWARKNNHATFFLGGGSNILVSDEGFDGLVIQLAQTLPKPAPGKRRVVCFSGCKLADLVEFCAEHGYTGMEDMAGIPGSVGGAVRGNAGAFSMETKDTLLSARAIHRDALRVRKFTKDECEFGYRQSFFKKNHNWIIGEALFEFLEGDTHELRKTMEEVVLKRNAKHRQDAQCAGSFFINPTVKNPEIHEMFKKESGKASFDGRVPAGWLVDKAGMRGKKIGGAQVSPDHPNYIINTGNATAEDVIILVSLVKQAVRDMYNIDLQQEVQFVGF